MKTESLLFAQAVDVILSYMGISFFNLRSLLNWDFHLTPLLLLLTKPFSVRCFTIFPLISLSLPIFTKQIDSVLFNKSFDDAVKKRQHCSTCLITSRIFVLPPLDSSRLSRLSMFKSDGCKQISNIHFVVSNICTLSMQQKNDKGMLWVKVWVRPKYCIAKKI